MIDALLSASQRRSLSPPAARRTTRALTSQRPKNRSNRRADAKSAHAHDRTGSSSSFPATKRRITGSRGDACRLLATSKSP